MIKRIAYNWRDTPDDSRSLMPVLSDRSYCGPVDLQGPVRLFGRDNQYVAVGPHWMITMLQSTGQNLQYKDRPKQLPSLVVDPDDGYLLVPFGEQMVMRTCGTAARWWQENDRTVLLAQAKNKFTHKLILFQVHFLYNTGVIEIHYKKAITGNQTVIGICGKPGYHSDWGCNSYEVLDKTAISIDTTVEAEAIEPDADTPPFPPSAVPTPDPTPAPVVKPVAGLNKVVITGENLVVTQT